MAITMVITTSVRVTSKTNAVMEVARRQKAEAKQHQLQVVGHWSAVVWEYRV